MKALKTPKMELLHGHTLKGIITFSLPILLGNIFRQLYNMVDSIV